VIANAPSARDVIVVELSDPRLRRGAVEFRAKLVKGSATDALRKFRNRADPRVGDTFGRVSLFIDPGGQPVDLTFTLTGIPAGGVFLTTFTNTELAHGSFPAEVVSTGPLQSVLALNAVILSSPGPGTVNATVSSGAVVNGGSLSGNVQQFPAGTSASVSVFFGDNQTRSQSIAAGPFSVPLK
jgi:hypothetical protein